MNLLRLLILGLLAWGGSPASAWELRDDSGQTVRFDAAPQRIISLLPSLTETVCALGQCAKLVGVDRYSNFPQSVRALPQVGGGLDPQIEAIVALKPDLVLVSNSSPGAQRMRGLGLKLLALEPRNFADATRVVRLLAQVLAVDTAPAVVQAMERDMRAAVQAVPVSARGKSVYFEVNPGPYAASESSFIGETLAQLGLKNIVPASLGTFPKINPEMVVRAQPDLILVGDNEVDDLSKRPGWSALAAIRAKRICVFDKQDSDTLVRPGPRLATGAMRVAQCLQRLYPTMP
jgi:iron complex transport system substrate-binding protein